MNINNQFYIIYSIFFKLENNLFFCQIQSNYRGIIFIKYLDYITAFSLNLIIELFINLTFKILYLYFNIIYLREILLVLT